MSKFSSRRANPGDPFMPIAHEYQRAIDKGKKPNPPSNPAIQKNPTQPYYQVQVYNGLDYDLDIGYPILLGDLQYNAGTAAGASQNVYFDVVEPASETGNDRDLAIVIETIPQGEWGWAAVSGVVYALTKGSDGKRASLLPEDDDDHTSKLDRSDSGNIRILGPIDDGCLIQLNGGGDATAIVAFTLTASLSTVGTTATATVIADSSGALDPDEAITVKGLIAYAAASGDKGLAVKIGSEYIVIECKQGSGSSSVSTALIHGLVDSRSGSPYGALQSDTTAHVKSGSLTAISSDFTFTPFSTCGNPFKLNGAEDDICIIARLPDSSFILIAVIPKKAPIFFTASSGPTDDGGTNKFSITVTSYNGPGEPPTYVHDVLNNAFLLRSGGTGFAEWNQTLGKWVITACKKPTLWMRGKCYEDFDDQPATIKVKDLTGVDGPPPTMAGSFEEYKNAYKAEQGEEDAEVLLMWNQAANSGDGEWEVVRVSCATVTSPAPPE